VNWFPLLTTLLLTGAAAAQQTRPSLLLRQKSVTLPATPEDATLRVARGTLTTLTFDSALDAKKMQLEGRSTHFERVVAEGHTLTLKPKVELKPGERLLLSVRFADSAAPQEATFELVTAGEEVDASVEVVRRARDVEALEAALAATQAQLAALQARYGEAGPESAVLAGWLTEDIRVNPLTTRVPPGHASGLWVERGFAFRAREWGLVVIHLRNAPGARPWALGQVLLSSARGAPIKVLSARLDKPHLGPGEKGQVLVRTEAPWWALSEELRLELRDAEGGRALPLGGMVF
jgi:uncharacterized protein (TIGR02268 family)